MIISNRSSGGGFMTKNDKKVLYMNDVPMFRAIMGGFVFAYYDFGLALLSFVLYLIA